MRCGGGCRGHGQCCDCLVCVCYVAVVCPLWCAHVYVLLLITTILWFSATDHCGCQDTWIFAAGLASHKKPQLEIEKYQIGRSTLHGPKHVYLARTAVLWIRGFKEVATLTSCQQGMAAMLCKAAQKKTS